MVATFMIDLKKKMIGHNKKDYLVVVSIRKNEQSKKQVEHKKSIWLKFIEE